MLKTKNLFEILFLFFLPVTLFAQDDTNSCFSIYTGGMVIKSSMLSTTKLGYEYSRLGFITDFTYDDYSETWQDGSRSHFKIYAISISGRFYIKPLGRSFFAEIYAGIGKPSVTTTENEQEKFSSTYIPISGFCLGWRFGKKPKGIFGEIGLRFTSSLKQVHLYTTETEPNTEGVDNISYQSWVFEKGQLSSQLYLGVGYSF